MIAFLTSTLGDFYLMDEMKVGLVRKNNFIENLRALWRGEEKGLFITADPEDFSGNDRMRDEFLRAFSDEGLPFSTLEICDGRCEGIDSLDGYGVLILGGGHVPTQNKFFEKINLFDKIKSFDGIFLSLSAGSMNSAREVYAIPELDGEATDPSYKRYLRGLGITECRMLPHYQYCRDVHLDGSRVQHLHVGYRQPI
jgi:peptidase E